MRATNEILTARMPRWSLSRAASIESAASWLWGRKISSTAPRSPPGWEWPPSPWSWPWPPMVMFVRSWSSP